MKLLAAMCAGQPLHERCVLGSLQTRLGSLENLTLPQSIGTEPQTRKHARADDSVGIRRQFVVTTAYQLAPSDLARGQLHGQIFANTSATIQLQFRPQVARAAGAGNFHNQFRSARAILAADGFAGLAAPLRQNAEKDLRLRHILSPHYPGCVNPALASWCPAAVDTQPGVYFVIDRSVVETKWRAQENNSINKFGVFQIRQGLPTAKKLGGIKMVAFKQRRQQCDGSARHGDELQLQSNMAGISKPAKAWGQNDDITGSCIERLTMTESELKLNALPNAFESQSKAFHGTNTCNLGWLFELFNRAVCSINFNRACIRNNKPCQLSTVAGPFLHFGAHYWQSVRSGFQFNHEFRRNVPQGSVVFQALQAFVRNPSRVGRSASTVSQEKSRAGIKGFPTSVLFRPGEKLIGNRRIPLPCSRMGRGHDEDVSFGACFNAVIRVLSAKLQKLIVCQRSLDWLKHGSGKLLELIHQQLHIVESILKRPQMGQAAKTWGQNDDITGRRVFSASGKQRCNANRETGQQRGFQSVAPFQNTNAGLRPHMHLDVFVIQQPHFPASGTEVIPDFPVHIHHVFGWGKYFHRDVRSVRKGNCFQTQLLPAFAEKDRKIGPADGVVADAAIGLANSSTYRIRVEIVSYEASCPISDNAMQKDWARQWDQFSVNQFIIFIFRRVHLNELFGGHQRFGCHAVMLLAGIYIHVIALDRNYLEAMAQEEVINLDKRRGHAWAQNDDIKVITVRSIA